MNFVPPREPREVRAASARCQNCGAPGQSCDESCFYCGEVVAPSIVEQIAEHDPRLAHALVKKPPAEEPPIPCPPRKVQE